MRSVKIFLFAKYYLEDQIKEGEMGGTCSTDTEYDKCVWSFRHTAWNEETTWWI